MDDKVIIICPECGNKIEIDKDNIEEIKLCKAYNNLCEDCLKMEFSEYGAFILNEFNDIL